MTTVPADEDVALKILHTADWHLGMRFPQFDEADQPKLTRARMTAVEKIFSLATSHRVDAVLCAGDLFDDSSPDRRWYEELSNHLRSHATGEYPIFLLPGNHDPLRDNSVYNAEHAFRRSLPEWVHVVDCDDFEKSLGDEGVLYAAPCRSQSGAIDPAMRLPEREPSDKRIRIGMVHGQTFDMEGHENNFPIAVDAAERRGFNYLALGDTHGYRELGTPQHRMLYPGTPESTRFGETDAGQVALVFFPRADRNPLVQKMRVGHWTWRDATCDGLEALRNLSRAELNATVLRLRVRMRVPITEHDEARQILAALKGTEVAHGRAGVLLADDSELHVDASQGLDFVEHLPDVLQQVARQLRAQAEDAMAERALIHLYSLVKTERSA